MKVPQLTSFILFVSLIANLGPCFAGDPTGPIEYNRNSCWDVGFVDYLADAGACQLACSFESNCNSWDYHHGGSNRCHLCSRTASTSNFPCSTADPCKTWGLRGENVSPISVLNDGIEKAAGVCTGALQGEEALDVAAGLNMVIDKFANGDYDSDEAFMLNVESAANDAANILQGENMACRDNFTSVQNNCKYGSLVFHQLRAFLLHVDGSPGRALPKKRNKNRRKLFNTHKIFLADNFWMTNKTVRKIFTFYAQLPSHMKTEGILYDALFATQTVRDAWLCNGSFPGYLHTTNRGFNVFQTQVGQAYEQAFPADTPDRPASSDLQLTVTRHEVSHQFDRIIYNRANDGDSRLRDMKTALTQASAGSDENWLRSQVGDSYFQSAPQEIIASQIGNQYLCSSSSQLRLAAKRLIQVSDWVPPSYQVVTVGSDTLTRENKSCANQSVNLGTFDSAQECVNEAMNHESCSYEIMYSSAYPSWGCRCCQPFDTMSCPVEDELYGSHDLWDIYQFDNTSNEPSCEGTGVPLSWFLFNVDLLTPVDSSVVPFYENEDDGKVSRVQSTILRDQSGKISSIDIPFCGVVSFTYDNNGIVDSVSDNAITCKCEDDMDWRFVKGDGEEVTCDWIGANESIIEKRCRRTGTDGRKAKFACPQTCNLC